MEGGVVRGITVPRHLHRCVLIAEPGVFDTGPQTDTAVLNTGTRVEELCDDFSVPGPAWEAAYNDRPTYGPKENTAAFEPYFGTVRIHTRGGYANLSRRFEQDAVSVRLRVYKPTGHQCGVPQQTHPMAALYWGRDRFIKCVQTNPWHDPERRTTQMFFFVSGGPAAGRHDCPAPGRFSWMRWDLAPEEVALYVAADGKSWQRIAGVPRGEPLGKGFAGAPSYLILGTGCEGPADRLRNDTPGIDDSYSTYDELIVETLPIRPLPGKE
jgi:hypothetical protein